jgi:hypothetical protein
MNTDAERLLFSTDSMPYGISFTEWTEKWWQWFLSIPKAKSPAADTDGRYCAEKQTDSAVWFLAGTMGGSAKRGCIIPEGKAILFPIITDEQSFAEKPDFHSDQELEALVKSEADKVIEMNVSVDGIKVSNPRKYRARTMPFDAVFPPNNIWGVKPGPTRAAADGYWLFLKPLSSGKHTIYFSGRGPHFFTEVAYSLSVEVRA